jgi:hypothetical protein
MKFTNYIFLILVATFLTACTSKESDSSSSSIKKEPFEPSVQKRAEKYRDGTGGILGDFRKQQGSGNFEFATSNVLWRASLKTLDFLPMQSVSYSGGILITDWYGSGKESIKIEVRFKSNTLESSSIEVKSFKKTCGSNSNCQVVANATDFNQSIKDKILASARELSIQDKNKNKK